MRRRFAKQRRNRERRGLTQRVRREVLKGPLRFCELCVLIPRASKQQISSVVSNLTNKHQLRKVKINGRFLLYEATRLTR